MTLPRNTCALPETPVQVSDGVIEISNLLERPRAVWRIWFLRPQFHSAALQGILEEYGGVGNLGCESPQMDEKRFRPYGKTRRLRPPNGCFFHNSRNPNIYAIIPKYGRVAQHGFYAQMAGDVFHLDNAEGLRPNSPLRAQRHMAVLIRLSR